MWFNENSAGGIIGMAKQWEKLICGVALQINISKSLIDRIRLALKDESGHEYMSMRQKTDLF